MQDFVFPLLILAIYRIKWPGYRFAESISYFGKIDMIIRAILFEISRASLSSGKDFNPLIALSVFLPHYPWFILLNLLSRNLTSVTTTMICIYGLDQPPFNKSIIFKSYALITLICALSSISSLT